MSKKTVALILSCVLILGVATGGTLAWLLDTTGEVKNVFTTSDVDIELTETTGTEYQMIPGYTIAKDPTVTVNAVSEKCYVFVKVEESSTKYTVSGTEKGFSDYLTYTVDNAWTALEGFTGVYYKVFENTDSDQTQAILTGNQVLVPETVTKAMMDAIDENEPTLTFTAYACQYYKSNEPSANDTNGTPFTPEEALANVSSNP